MNRKVLSALPGLRGIIGGKKRAGSRAHSGGGSASPQLSRPESPRAAGPPSPMNRKGSGASESVGGSVQSSQLSRPMGLPSAHLRSSRFAVGGTEENSLKPAGSLQADTSVERAGSDAAAQPPSPPLDVNTGPHSGSDVRTGLATRHLSRAREPLTVDVLTTFAPLSQGPAASDFSPHTRQQQDQPASSPRKAQPTASPDVKPAATAFPLPPGYEHFSAMPRVAVLGKPVDPQSLDPDKIQENSKLVQYIVGALAALRPMLMALPVCDMQDLCTERAVLGCSFLGCSSNRGVPEQELPLLGCEECEQPKYCSKECSEAAFREGHYCTCKWFLVQAEHG